MAINRRPFIARSASALGAATATGVAPLALAVEEDVLDVGGEPQLLIDDWIVARSEGLERRLHQPAKQGLIKEADGGDGQRGDVYNGGIVFRDGAGKFHMTYRHIWWDPDLEKTIGEDRAHWHHVTVGYATSDDGIHWHKPSLGLLEAPTGFKRQDDFPFEVPIGMSKDNNLGCPIDFACDLHANGGLADPDRRLLVRLSEYVDTSPFHKPRSQRLYFASEWPDMVGDPKWLDKLTPIPDGRLSPRGFSTLCGYDQATKVWLFTGQDTIGNWVPRGGRDIIRQTSPDLVRWNDPELALKVADDESRTAEHWIEYMSMDGYRVGGPRSGAWLGQLVIFDSDRSSPQYEMPTIKNVWRKGITWLRLVTSRDAGRSWHRVADKQTWLPAHPDDDGYDRLVFSTQPTRVGHELRFYYAAWDGDHLVFNKDGSTHYKNRTRINRTAWATLRLDGYASLDATARGGELLTKPLRFEGRKLMVNLSAPRGALRAELVDESRTRIEGFSMSDSLPTTGDAVELPVRWHRGAELSKLAGKPIRVRFHLSDASLYAFRFG